ncbi:hypothetical protein HTZ84_22010 [Haloterrigena sp. SYSU A558-1]|uniref:Uncharacterized protein n=1 Tax=Haloterrigena gelatinilytica TaxID=2741724 RepID=A0ABX2LMQ6_9EURY|nr:hypothetical protein [Haloterrigena gelatinilytica]NUC74942.1 hypothetical protein [Haloterrigena gelatinilytica]
MPDDNRFAGLSDAVEDDPDEESDAESAAADSSSEETDSPAAEDAASVSDSEDSETGGDSSGSESDSSAETGDTDTDTDADGGDDTGDNDPTAFPFDATEKKTVYVRPETLADLDDARALVDAQLRTDHDVRDLTGREFYDAVFRLAAADTEGVIDEILEAREE